MTRKSAGQPHRLAELASRGELPLASPCPNRCRFCYERHLNRFFPALQVVRNPRFTEHSFASFMAELERQQQPAVPATPCTTADDTVLYSSASDVFAQGLSRSMLSSLLERNAACGSSPMLATQGDSLDPELARELSAAHPDTFRVHLSVLTFDHETRTRLIPGSVGPEHLGKLISALREAKIYLLHTDPGRTIADLQQVNRWANRQAPPLVILARLHHHRLHPSDVKALSEQSAQGFEEVVDWLMRHHDELVNIGEICCHFPAEAYIWSFRSVIRNRLLPLLRSRRDVVLCSRAAFPIMRDFVVGDTAQLHAVTDRLGGSTDFATTIGTAEVVELLGRLRTSGVELERVVVPSSIWWVDDRSSLDGGTADELRAAFPGLEVEVVPVPVELVNWRLSVEQCHHFFNADLEATLALRRRPDLQQTLGHSLGRHAQLTEAGFVRRLWTAAEQVDLAAGRDSTPMNPRQLASAAGAHQLVVVEYHEPVVERSDDIPRPGRRLVLVGETQLLVREVPAGRVRLHGRLEQAAFGLLFVEGRDQEEVVSRLVASRIEQREGVTADEIARVVASLHRSWRHLERPSRMRVAPDATGGRSTYGS